MSIVHRFGRYLVLDGEGNVLSWWLSWQDAAQDIERRNASPRSGPDTRVVK